jgi:acetyl/propionyl-CoA carboxylase alpha subunit
MKKIVLINENEITIDLLEADAKKVHFIYDDVEYFFEKRGQVNQRMVLDHDGQSQSVLVSKDNKIKGLMNIFTHGEEFQIELPSKGRAKKRGDEEGHMISPMPGKILKVLVIEGDEVVKGDPLVIMEAMKMEHTIKANCNGIIKKIFFKEDELIEGSTQLIEIEKELE